MVGEVVGLLIGVHSYYHYLGDGNEVNTSHPRPSPWPTTADRHPHTR